MPPSESISRAITTRKALVILLLLVAAAGLPLFLLGGLLQINLMGHGPVTSTQRLGVALMFAGPALTLAFSVGALLLARGKGAKIIAGMGSFMGLGLLTMTTLAVYTGRAEERHRQQLREVLSQETQYFAETADRATREASRGAPAILLVGRYETRGDATIVDGFVIGARESFSPDLLRPSAGSVSRFIWVDNSVSMELPAPGLRGKTLLVPQSSPSPPMEYHISPNGNRVSASEPEPVSDPAVSTQPYHRFLFLLSNGGPTVRLNTPFGELELPPISKQPVRVVRLPTFRDQRTRENAAWVK